MDRTRLEHILRRMKSVKAGVVGDICLDVYWEAEMMRSELSRETPHYPLPVVRERYTPGAGGNAAANLRALGCGEVAVCTAFGRDWRADVLRRSLREAGIEPESFAVESSDWCTPAYCKPIRVGLQDVRQEDPRLDFQNYAPLPIETDRLLAAQLDRMAAQVDVIAVADQFKHGVVGESVIERLKYWEARGKLILVDSRDRVRRFAGLPVKPNEIEALGGRQADERDRARGTAYWSEVAAGLAEETGSRCFLTAGEHGSYYAERGRLAHAPSLPVRPPIDTVGAGDSFGAGLLASLGAGASPEEAMAIGHLTAAVTIRKLGMTGTASPEEILAAFEEYYA